jgi:hypothetical protein
MLFALYIGTILTTVVYLQYQETIDDMISSYTYTTKEPSSIEMTSTKH